MSRIFCWLLACSIFFNINAQTTDLFGNEIALDDSPVEKLKVDMSIYFHNGIRPGLNFSTEFPKKRYTVEKEKYRLFGISFGDGSTKQIKRHFLVKGNTGIYVHRQNHTGFYLNFQYVYRRINQRNRALDAGLGIGVLRAFLPTTYKYTDEGFKKVFLPGRFFLTIPVSFCYSRQINFLTSEPFDAFVRPTIYAKVPYNHFFNMAYSVEWGIRFKFLKNPKWEE